ncbi:MAG: 16S rRNA (cytosine(1402)-N(4))-methyltransferase RsmH [Planctomycetes bacterium]|nr:16S rRNA (cytosine(1402)-N(4))-methyltransferase RsmH [Planctomycetota bacterium]
MSFPSQWSHRSVLVAETLRYLAPRAGEWMADGTVGLGGHAAEILPRLAPGGFLLGIDRDRDALEIARRRLEPCGGEFRLFHGRYTRLADFLRLLGRAPEGALDGFLLDLGVSSLQLDRSDRGFSLRHDGPLDMRMDPGEGESAAEFLKRARVEELEDVFRRFGEERDARRIARAIDEQRRKRPIETTAGLAAVIEKASPRRGRRLHPATKCFMAIRIAVNGELDDLSRILNDLDRFLRRGGRAVFLSYHSLEDRLVKRVLGRRVREGLYRWALDGAARPSAREIEENPRSRSARLRAVIRTAS